jgi:hypothetical protein
MTAVGGSFFLINVRSSSASKKSKSADALSRLNMTGLWRLIQVFPEGVWIIFAESH